MGLGRGALLWLLGDSDPNHHSNRSVLAQLETRVPTFPIASLPTWHAIGLFLGTQPRISRYRISKEVPT